ncbi:hypothetical protein AVEN_144936-1, partial [Araneus ventricosus]
MKTLVCLTYICYRERPKFGECRLSPVNVNIHIVAWCMSKIFAKYPYFSLTPTNVDIQHALMVNVEYVEGLHFLLRVSGAIKRHKGDATFSSLLLRGVTNHDRDSNFWVGTTARDEVHTWMDGVPMEHEPWIQRNNSIPGSCYIYTGAHSFIGDMTGNCLYRTPDATTKENADAKCAEHGGRFLDLPEILMDGLSAFLTHKVMVNDSLKYWTDLKLNGTSVVTTAGEPVFGNEDSLTLNTGRGECITVSFNLQDVLKTQLYQTDCKDHAYVICGAPTITSRITTLAPPLQQQIRTCPVGQNWKEYPATNACYW